MTDALRPAADFLSRRSVPDPQAPTVRPRRLRTTPAMRRLAREHVVDPSALILPVFVREDIDDPRPVEAMPGVVQHTLDSLRREAAACAEAGIGAIDLFGVPATRDEAGTAAWAEEAACSANQARYAETLYSTSTVAAFAEFACHDLGFVDREHLAVVELEHGIFDNERPHLIAQSIVMQVTLDIAFRLDVVGERLGNRLVKLLQHLHRQDWVDVPRLDQLV